MSSKRPREVTSSSSSSTAFSPETKNFKMDDEISSEEPPTLTLIYKALMELKKEMTMIRQDNEERKKEYEEMKKSMDFQSKEIIDLRKDNENLKTKCKTQEEAIKTLNFNVSTMEARLDEMNQYQRKYNLEIHGVPEKTGEDLESVVEEVAKVLEVEEDVDRNDIDIVHRLPSKLIPRPIIVKFRNYDAKKTLYESRWKLRRYQGKNPNLNEAKKVFINENLTKQRRILFAEVRGRARVNEWYSTWTVDGKIFVKTSKEEKARKINQQADLEELY